MFGSAEASSLRRATALRWPSGPSGAHSPEGRNCTVQPTIANRHRYPQLIPARHHGAASDSRLRIAVLAPISWRTPPRHYGPWEQFASLLADGLVAAGHDVTLFATADSLTTASLQATASGGWSDDLTIEPKVAECIHIASAFERAADFDIIHNGFDFLPLTYSGLVDTPVITTIHGFSSQQIVPVYERYDATTHYVAISNADRSPRLHYVGTVYHGINLRTFTYRAKPDDYLVFLGRIHPDKGTAEAIEIARHANRRLILAGIVQDTVYFRNDIQPQLDGDRVTYIGSVGPETRDRLLGGAVALLHPISFSEPFGLSVVEAMACGTPVVAFDRGSMPELIQDSSTGFLVRDVDEAIAALRRVPGLDRQACRQHVEQRFTVKRMVDDYVGVYRSVLGRERRTAGPAAAAGVR